MSVKTKDELVTEFDSTVTNGGEATAAEFRTLNENTIDSLDNFRTAYGDSKGTFKASGNSDLSIDESGDFRFIAANDAIIQQEYNGATWDSLPSIKTFDITITSAEILALNSTPKTLVSSAGADTVIIPISISAQLVYGTTPYATNGDFDIYCGGTLNVFAAGTDDDFIFGSVSKVVNLAQRTSGGATDTFYVANSALTAKMSDGNPTAGDSDVRIWGQYYVKQI